jgi:hypothetical protein
MFAFKFPPHVHSQVPTCCCSSDICSFAFVKSSWHLFRSPEASFARNSAPCSCSRRSLEQSFSWLSCAVKSPMSACAPRLTVLCTPALMVCILLQTKGPGPRCHKSAHPLQGINSPIITCCFSRHSRSSAASFLACSISSACFSSSCWRADCREVLSRDSLDNATGLSGPSHKHCKQACSCLYTERP